MRSWSSSLALSLTDALPHVLQSIFHELCQTVLDSVLVIYSFPGAGFGPGAAGQSRPPVPVGGLLDRSPRGTAAARFSLMWVLLSLIFISY